MAMLALLFVTLCAGLLGPADAAFRSTEGTPTTIERYPALVQVEFRAVYSGIWSQSCAANILTSYFVLSTASCFHGINYDAQNRRIRAGTTYRNTGGYLAYVEVEFNHPSYGRNGHDGDISVVKLIDSLVFGPTIAQGTIVAQGAVVYEGLPIVHAGWGATIQGGSASEMLLRNNIYTINKQTCRDRYENLSIPEVVTDNMICVGFLGDADLQACRGDYGGPLYYSDNQAGDIIVGLVSWGHGCANATFPGVGTAVASYTDWIIATAVST